MTIDTSIPILLHDPEPLSLQAAVRLVLRGIEVGHLPDSTVAPRDGRGGHGPAQSLSVALRAALDRGAVRELPTLIERLDAHLDAGAGEDWPRPIPPGYRIDSRRRLVPESLVPAPLQLEDQAARTIAAYALDLHHQIQRWARHSHDDVATLLDLLVERYHAPRRGGRRGNVTLRSHDGRVRVQVQVQDRIALGPELQAARDLVTECVADWTADARAEVQALIQHALEPDAEGRVSLAGVLALRRLEIDDARWRGAQAAISDAIRVVGTARYIRAYLRCTPEAPWQAIAIDAAAAPLAAPAPAPAPEGAT